MAKHVVAALEELPPGSRKLVTIESRSIALFNIGGEFFALLDRCPHRGGSLCKGRLTGLVEAKEPGRYVYSRPGEILRCPWHGWEFDIRTGRSRCDPEKVRTRSYEVAVASGGGIAEGPYEVQTFEVAVEKDYVVLTV
jgi:3-phenylpropionate/trans-cinnamate dioxygenase ferredoxin subunit